MSTSEKVKTATEMSQKSRALKSSILARLKAHDAAVRSGNETNPDLEARPDTK